MNRFRWLCLIGLCASLLVWVLPARFKPYHIKRDLDDYKIELVELDSEWGFAASGLVKAHIAETYVPPGGKRQLLSTSRQEWIDKTSHSRTPWPVVNWELYYDEWGPSHTTRDDGVEVIQTGTTVSVPYSIFALLFAIPLIQYFMFRRRRKS